MAEKAKSELETILAKQRKEYQRYLGVVSESFESQVKLIAESVGGVQEQLTSIRDLVAKNTEDLEMMKTELHIIRQDLKVKIDRDEFVVLENRVARLEKTSSRRK